MTLTKKIIEEFDEKFNKELETTEIPSYIAFDLKSFLRSSLHQVATEAIEAVRLERQIISGDFDAGYNSAIEDMEENAKKFLENL